MAANMPSPVVQFDAPVPKDWRYEMRREAQEILPNLFVGPYQSSKDLEYLLNLGITHILCVAELREAHFVKPRFPEKFAYHVLEVRDAEDQNLIRIFPSAKQFIDHALQGGGKILVHCGDGISRSPAIVTAYVMVTHGLSHDDAFQFVQARRFCVSPNAHFQHQIENYESIHRASLAMAQTQAQNQVAPQNRNSRRKRSGSESEDDSDQMALRKSNYIPAERDIISQPVVNPMPSSMSYHQPRQNNGDSMMTD